MGKVFSKKNMNCLLKPCCILVVLYLLYVLYVFFKPVITEALTAGDSVYPDCSNAVNGIHQVMCAGKSVGVFNRPDGLTDAQSLVECNKKAKGPTGGYEYGMCGMVGPKGTTGADGLAGADGAAGKDVIPSPFNMDCTCSKKTSAATTAANV